MSELKTKDTPEIKLPQEENFKNIKSETGIPLDKAIDFLNSKFEMLSGVVNDIKDSIVGENTEESYETEVDKAIKEYVADIKDKSEVPDTIADTPFEVADLEKRTPEENAKMREEFDYTRASLKKEWEELNGIEWPKYENDVHMITKSGKDVVIREAGADYDAHHIHPLGLGGMNDANNITPMHVDIHLDHRGVHELGSPYDRLDKLVGGSEV